MPRKPQTPVKGIFTDVAILAGFGIACLVAWLVVLVVLAGLIFLGLTAFTNWNFGTRIGSSLLSAFVTMKVLSFIYAALDLIPESWIDGKRKRKHALNVAKIFERLVPNNACTAARTGTKHFTLTAHR